MLKEYFDSLAQGIEEQIKLGSISPRKLYALEIAHIGQKLYSGQHNIAWTGVLAPFELLNSLNITSCFVEFVGAMLASMGLSSSFIEESQQAGYGTDMCSYHRTIIGAQKKGLMPIPHFLVATSCPCSGGMAVIETLARNFQKKLFVLHIPQDVTPATVAYMAAQLEELHHFAAEQTGQRADVAKLKEAVENSNRTREVLLELFDLARTIPSPVATKDLSNFAYIAGLLMGTPKATELALSFRDLFAQRIRDGVSGIKGEKLRLLWIQNRIQFKNPLEKFLEEEHRATVVVDEMNCVYWDRLDPQNPYESIAMRIISNPFNGPASRRIEHLKSLAKKYKIDGAINPCNWGCRQGTGSRGLTAMGLKEIDVPVLNMETDCVDNRNFFEGQIKTRLSAFMEMLESHAR